MPYLNALLLLIGFMTLLWIVSVILKNASIVDPFWGICFIILNSFYLIESGTPDIKKVIVMILVSIWGLRLALHLFIRNKGKGEDFRYRKFRQDYGPHRYWWFSFFQVFLLQGILAWLVSAPLLAINNPADPSRLSFMYYPGIVLWIIGFIFEAGGDFQLVRFRSDPSNKGKLLDKGFWKYTRHPNYFGDACAWWGFGLMGIAAGGYINILGSLLMTLLLIRVSGVLLLEKSLKEKKPGYKEYVSRTSAFIPWFPRK